MGKEYDVDIIVDARPRKAREDIDRPPAMTPKRAAKEREKDARRRSSEDKGRRQDEEESDEEDSDLDECCQLQPWRYPLYSPSASYRQLDVVAGSHHYTISGFSLARSMGCGTRLCSDFFEICGQLFRLEVYPGGFTADTRKFISVFLTTPGAVNPSHILYEIAILDQSGKDRHIIESRGANDRSGLFNSRCCMQGPLLAYSRGIVAAVPKFIKAKFLDQHASRYMPCDMLVFRTTVQVLQGWSSPPMVHPHGGVYGYSQPGMQQPGSVMAPGLAAVAAPGMGGLLRPPLFGTAGAASPFVRQQPTMPGFTYGQPASSLHPHPGMMSPPAAYPGSPAAMMHQQPQQSSPYHMPMPGAFQSPSAAPMAPQMQYFSPGAAAAGAQFHSPGVAGSPALRPQYLSGSPGPRM